MPDEEGPVHAYITAAPGCWRMFLEVGARSVGWALSPGIVQLRTDAYASQHSTNPDPRNRQSVAVHLMSLCASLELRLPPGSTTHLLGSWTHRPGGYPDFTDASPPGAITIVELHSAVGQGEYEAVVEAWAQSVWGSYGAVHDAVRALLTEAGIGNT